MPKSRNHILDGGEQHRCRRIRLKDPSLIGFIQENTVWSKDVHPDPSTLNNWKFGGGLHSSDFTIGFDDNAINGIPDLFMANSTDLSTAVAEIKAGIASLKNRNRHCCLSHADVHEHAKSFFLFHIHT